MRDPARIERVLAVIRQAWEEQPDLRLGQLVVIATQPAEPCPELFLIEDEALVEGINRYQQVRAGNA